MRKESLSSSAAALRAAEFRWSSAGWYLREHCGELTIDPIPKDRLAA